MRESLCSLINAWYAALNLHLAEKGVLTDEDRIAILARVQSQCKDMELYMVNEGQQPFSTRELIKKFEKIAMFSARSQP